VCRKKKYHKEEKEGEEEDADMWVEEAPPQVIASFNSAWLANLEGEAHCGLRPDSNTQQSEHGTKFAANVLPILLVTSLPLPLPSSAPISLAPLHTEPYPRLAETSTLPSQAPSPMPTTRTSHHPMQTLMKC